MYSNLINKSGRSFVRCGLSLVASNQPWNNINGLSDNFSAAAMPYGNQYDVVVVGGGIIGCSTAERLLTERPNLRVVLIEKENRIAAHQSGHNSGVIHAGIYYAPGSLKAKLCVEGLKLTYEYFDKHNIPYKQCGKLIVALDATQETRLKEIYRRGIVNQVPGIELIEGARIKEIEPHCVGIRAIYSPYTGIVDWGHVTKIYSENFEKLGGSVILNFEVKSFEEGRNPNFPIDVFAVNGLKISCRHLVACAGLHSDRLAEMSGADKLPKIIPFRGDYLLLKPHKCHFVRGNIYPVPDPRFPFLGVHFTPRLNGEVWLGPNAVLAFHREGYKFTDVDVRDLWETVKFSGLRKLLRRNLFFALDEFYRGVNIYAQVNQLRKFIPELCRSDVSYGPSGVRAMAMNGDGTLVDDFVFEKGGGRLGPLMLHIRNAPSPAATSSLAIARAITNKVIQTFDL